MKNIVLFFVVALLLSMPARAVETIAVVVNDDAISVTDVNDRLRLIMVSAGFPDNEEIKKRLLPQVISSLIDEQLMIQEANKENIIVSKKEIDEGFEQLAKQNNVGAEQFKNMLRDSHINPATLERQMAAQIGWGQVIHKKFFSQVNINDADIDSFIERLKSDIGKQEFLTAEILLPVDNPSKEEEIRKLADNIYEQVKAGKASFGRMAQQFSKAPGSQQGGNLGWIQEGQLPVELDGILKTLDRGQVSQPFLTQVGYHLLFVIDRRTITEESIPSREAVRKIIGTERLERIQARHLMDLKSSAFIENRV